MWALVSLAGADERAWSSGSAAELTRQGREHAQAGDEEIATARFAEAVRLDPTYGPAYLELAQLREKHGDLVEAERTYGVAIEHVAEFVEAYRARAALFARMGESDRELADLEAATRISGSPAVRRELAQRYVAARAWPAALATWRKLREVAEERGDNRALGEASLQIRALVLLCGELDPVTAGGGARGGPDWRGSVRRSEASIARRRGQ
jgi:tetratricopeptide (TPR) repeat protein